MIELLCNKDNGVVLVSTGVLKLQ